MDGLENMRAFLAVAQTQSFTMAARRLGVSPSVVTKRVSQLEWRLGAALLQRTTRSVQLTDLGERQQSRMQRLIRDYDELVAGVLERPEALEGALRISAPAAMTTLVLPGPLAAFRHAHPAVTLDIVVLDRSVNPVEEGFDIAIVVVPATYDGVVEEVLCPYPRLLCAAPDYLRGHGRPAHPSDLTHHACIAFQPSGPGWTFQGRSGPVSVAVRPVLSSTDSRVVIEMVRKGMGISVLSLPTVAEALRRKQLVALLPDFPLPDLSVKAFVPPRRAGLARVRAFLDHLRQTLQSLEPKWKAAL
ncbi:MAG: LysR family transcriptional regulator [Hyphomicrobiales bacterium]